MKKSPRCYPPNSDLDVLFKRVLYGGRKGRAARKRLADWSGNGDRPFTKYMAYSGLLSEGKNNDLNIIKQYRRTYKKNMESAQVDPRGAAVNCIGTPHCHGYGHRHEHVPACPEFAKGTTLGLEFVIVVDDSRRVPSHAGKFCR